uniref:Uncharacterized protein n=1 Tax=Steinernema glaseri TaxID=37863 RepID=A0A1I7YED8_9BILA
MSRRSLGLPTLIDGFKVATGQKIIRSTSSALQLQPPECSYLYRALKMEWPAATGFRAPTPHASSSHFAATMKRMWNASRTLESQHRYRPTRQEIKSALANFMCLCLYLCFMRPA